jgi:hypothetical protein
MNVNAPPPSPPHPRSGLAWLDLSRLHRALLTKKGPWHVCGRPACCLSRYPPASRTVRCPTPTRARTHATHTHNTPAPLHHAACAPSSPNQSSAAALLSILLTAPGARGAAGAELSGCLRSLREQGFC